MFHSSSERPICPPYYVRNSKDIINGTTLMPRFASENFAPTILQAGRYLQPPPPPFVPLNQSLPPNYFSLQYQYQQPPPLLPLPISKPQTRALSCPFTTNTSTKSLGPPWTHKKSKKKSKNAGKGENLKSDTATVLSPRQVVKDSSAYNPSLGLPKHQLPNNNVSHNVSTSVGCVKEIEKQYDVVDTFSAGWNCDRALFRLSPPPSSLPLPTFSLRPKLSCPARPGCRK